MVLALAPIFFASGGFAKPARLARSETAPVLDTRFLTFRLSPQDGSYEILDKQTRVSWRSNPYKPRFGEVTLVVDGQKQKVELGRCEVRQIGRASCRERVCLQV
jgi:hypothetical protein